jgi:hypothetical protein
MEGVAEGHVVCRGILCGLHEAKAFLAFKPISANGSLWVGGNDDSIGHPG